MHSPKNTKQTNKTKRETNAVVNETVKQIIYRNKQTSKLKRETNEVQNKTVKQIIYRNTQTDKQANEREKRMKCKIKSEPNFYRNK